MPGWATVQPRLLAPRPATTAVSGRSDSTGAAPVPWLGKRARAGVATWSSPPVERRRSPPAPGGFGGLPVPRGQQARGGHAEASPQQRCSGQLERTEGGCSLRPGCCTGPNGRDPERRSPGCAHVAQHATPNALGQVVAGSTTFVVTPRRAPMHAPGPSYGGSEGCESAETPLPPMGVPGHPS